MGRIIDQADVIRDVLRRPTTRHQLFTRLSGIGRAADCGDDFVDVGDGNCQTTQDVATFTRFAQQVCGAAGNDVFTEINEGCQELAQSKLFRATTVQGQHVTAEGCLHRRVAEQLVQHDLGRGIALQFDDNTHTVAVRFILNVGDALDPLFTGGFGDLFDHRCLVHLIGDFVDDNRPTVFADFFNPRFRPDDHRTTALKVRFVRARAAQHDASCRKIGARDVMD